MTTRYISYSEIDAARQCRLKHHLTYRELWQPEKVSEALSRGSLFHKVLEMHYLLLSRTNASAEDSRDLLIRHPDLLYNSETGEQTDEQNLVQWMYEGYVDNYGGDHAWEILDVEFKVSAWLLTPSGGRSSFKLNGTVDLLVRDSTAGDGLWIVDHKTCKDLPKQRELDLDDQMALYTYLLRQQGLDVRGAIYNAVRSNRLKRGMEPKERFLRRLTVRPDQELEIIAEEVLDFMRDTYRPSHRDLPPRSPDTDRCRWRCPFTEPCLMSRKGIPIRPLLEDLRYIRGEPRYGPKDGAR